MYTALTTESSKLTSNGCAKLSSASNKEGGEPVCSPMTQARTRDVQALPRSLKA